LAGLLALASRALAKKSQLANLAKIVGMLAMLCFAIATGVAVASAIDASELPAFVASIPAFIYGVWRSNVRRFSSSTIISVSAVVFVLLGLAMGDLSKDAAGIA
jgi:hypothetical protein